MKKDIENLIKNIFENFEVEVKDQIWPEIQSAIAS
jgi:hypothetical protein